MAEMVGISVSSEQRIWRAHGLKPHRVREFKLSNDPAFAAKLKDVVGLYVDPPDHAVARRVGRQPPAWKSRQRGSAAVPGEPSKCDCASSAPSAWVRFVRLWLSDGQIVR
jgi:hypothetical protein